MTKYKKYYWVLFFVLYLNTSFAQKPCVSCDSINKNLKFDSLFWERTADNVYLKFNVDISNLDLKKNESVIIMPASVNNEFVKNHKGIMICGRNSYLMMKRGKTKRLSKEGVEIKSFGRPSDFGSKLSYKELLGEEAVNKGKDIILQTFFVGCGSKAQLINETFVPTKKHNLPYVIHPQFLYKMPEIEPIKSRSTYGKAFLKFEVNKSVIDTNYQNNAEELAKIQKSFDVVINDRNIDITSISIHGFASPEGSYGLNKKLAADRSMALMEYIRNRYKIDTNLCTVISTAEDWDGLLSYLNEYQNDMAKEIASLLKISDNMDPDKRENMIREKIGEKRYNHVLKEIYPTLRHSDYEIKYNVREFDVEEGKAYLKTRPAMLSLREMFLIAQSYPNGSEEFKEVFDIAVRLFPNDSTANYNAANIALEERNFEKAKLYLRRSTESPETVYLKGLYYLLQDDFINAEMYLLKAEQKGISLAKDALEQIKKRKNSL